LASSTDLCSPLGLTRLVAIRYIFGLTVQARTRLPPIQITHTDYPRWLGSHRIAIWYISGLAIRACTHAAPVGLSPDCHSLDVWSRCSGAHPIATHTFSPVRLSPDCHSVDIWACHSGVHPIATRADLHASRALTRLPFGIYLFSPFGHTPNCYPCSAGRALTRLPFARYLVSLFGSAPDCHPYMLAGQRLPFSKYLVSPFGHAGWALTRLPFGKYLVSPFGHAPS